MENKKPQTFKDLMLKVRIKSNSRNIVIPKNITFGFIADTTGLLSLQFQKMKNRSYINVTEHGFIDDLPFESIFDTLQKNDARELEFYIGGI